MSNCVRMHVNRLAASTCLFFLALPPFAHAQTLQTESQQEFRRIFGFSGVPGTTAPVAGQNALVRPTLQPESATEFRRIFGQNVLAGTAELQKMTTPTTIDSTILTALIASADKRRYLVLWHLIAVDLTAIDHRASLAASPTTYHEQFGPARTARALALIHLAMFEAANAFEHKYTSLVPGLDVAPTAGASQDAAIIEAAYQVIAWLYPGLNDQQVDAKDDPTKLCTAAQFSLSSYYTCSLATISNDDERNAGIAIGRAIAGKIIGDRSHDGAERPEPIWGKDFIPRQAPGGNNYPFTQWQQDPVSLAVTALGGYWGEVKPFVMTSGFEFRPSESKSPSSIVSGLPLDPDKTPIYKDLPSYNAVYTWGRETRLDESGKITQPPQSGDGFFVAQFWAYDATANLCAPVRLYNQIAAAALAHLEATPADGYANVIDVRSITDVARFYALINIAMGDASIAAWDAKFHFQFPRPVTYIRANEELKAVKQKKPVSTKWFPVGAQVSNSDQTNNITPPFPAYPSGHATFGGALFGTLRQFLKPGAKFEFLSDEFNGQNKDVFNYVRCSAEDKLTNKKFCSQRQFTLDCAERENADSRIFMGVHWIFDADDGIVIGNKVAGQVYHHAMKPVDAQGQPFDAPSQLFSADPTVIKKRGDLVCPGIALPTGWDDTDATKGFGSLSITPVN
jgi:PAP2 superfamily